MRLLCAVHRMDVDGSGVYFAGISKALKVRGHQVQIVSAGGPLVGELEVSGVVHNRLIALDNRFYPPYSFVMVPRPYVVGIPRRLAAWVQFTMVLPYAICRLASLIHQFAPDVLYVHSGGAAWVAHLACRRTRVPFIVMVGSPWIADASSPMWPSVIPRVVHVMAYSEEVLETLRRCCPPLADRAEVFLPPIDCELFRPGNRDEQLRGRMLLVSRVVPFKWYAIQMTVSAVPLIRSRFPEASLQIVGDGPAMPALCALAKQVNDQCSDEAVRLLGTRRDIPALLEKADLYLGVGTTVLEAMAMGVPAIVIGHGSSLGVGEYGGVVGPQNLERLRKTNFTGRNSGVPLSSERIASDVIGLLEDEGAYWELSRFSRDFVLRHASLDRHVDRLEMIFQGAAS